ncbi:hypothetical protein ACU635_57090 [[Actinomadura] parvosata]|nr:MULTISPECIES: hypothetical protein [unclassified Nonomuraea]NJP98233.1 hypothetical protein [Nonomuraea sp. FMUSA5-5]
MANTQQGSGQEIYVTSSTIAHTRSRMDDELKPAVEHIHGLLPMTTVDGLGFGQIGGLFIQGAYEQFRTWLDTTLGEAETCVQECSTALGRARRNWRAAEEASMVRYRG